MTNKKEHLSYEERFCIEKMLGVGNSIGVISHTLGRGLSTISQEISNNGGKRNYKALNAQNRSDNKQRGKKYDSNKIINSLKLRKFVDKQLKMGLSAEAVAAFLKQQVKLEYASSKSIRKYIKQNLLPI